MGEDVYQYVPAAANMDTYCTALVSSNILFSAEFHVLYYIYFPIWCHHWGKSSLSHSQQSVSTHKSKYHSFLIRRPFCSSCSVNILLHATSKLERPDFFWKSLGSSCCEDISSRTSERKVKSYMWFTEIDSNCHAYRIKHHLLYVIRVDIKQIIK